MKLLVISDEAKYFNAIKNELSNRAIDFEFLDVRRGHTTDELMDIYEVIQPELCGVLRSEIEAINPDKIVTVGGLDGYVWNGTIVTRLFGQFNSWNGQRENQSGHTVLTINEKSVPLVAIYEASDWDLTNEAANS